MLKKTLAGAALAVALIITPVAAHAATYVPNSNVSVSNPSPVAGGEAVVTFTEAFTPGENVSFAVTGEGTATLAVLKAGTATLTKQADANGTAAVKVTLPTNATGTYTVTATGQTSGTVGTAAITVKAADGGKGEVVGGGKDSASGLPRTGGELPGGLIWIAGGASVLGLALIVTLAVRRKNA